VLKIEEPKKHEMMQVCWKQELKRLVYSRLCWKLLMTQEPKKLEQTRHEKTLEPMRLGRSKPFRWMLLKKQEHSKHETMLVSSKQELKTLVYLQLMHGWKLLKTLACLKHEKKVSLRQEQKRPVHLMGGWMLLMRQELKKLGY
jgi:hypothetical protein